MRTSISTRVPRRRFLASAASLTALSAGWRGSRAADWPLAWQGNFESPKAMESFQFTDPSAWKHVEDGGRGTMELTRQSKYQPPVRSPVNIALVKAAAFGSFRLEVLMKQTGREYGHRDMCLFFGFQSPQEFYYAHLATAADDHAHNVFIVNKTPRTKIARETTQGVNWGLDVWRKIALERRLEDGSIRVWFDDMEKPIMLAEEKTFGVGHVGFGSFDDTGRVAEIKIWADRAVERAPAPFVAPAL